tara:strand:+ start:274 stop:1164 length:891 start_codon:yes stop_codon:yes gene_type:complete
MKTKTNFATTSDVRNLINATMETFPKGPERDGIQTKMFNYWDNFNAGNNLPAGSDRKRFVAEALDNANAALRIAQTLVNKGQQFSDAYIKVTDLISKLSKIKVGKNEMAKVEDKFYGKRVVKGIFAKAKFAKMSPEKVKILTEAVQQIVKEKPLITRKYYADHGLSERRWAFDIFWAAQKKLPTNFLSDLWKEKLNDDHIYTVLKSALKSYSSRTGSKAKFGWPKSKFDIGDYVAIVGGSSNSVGKVSYTNYVDNKVDGGWKYKVIFPNGTMTFNEGSLKLAKPSSAAVSLIQARQ